MKVLWVSANCGEQEAVVLVQDDNNNNNNKPFLMLRQWQTTVPPPSSEGAIWWDMELVYAGRGWLGLGFNANGKMVGSTVVVGVPTGANDEMDESITPAGIYYLGERNPQDILPLSEATDSTETKQGSTFMSNATATPSMSPSATTTTSRPTTKPDTRIPTMVPTVASTTNNPTVVPTYPPSISLPKDSTLNPTMVDTQSRTTVPTNDPLSSPTIFPTLDAMGVPIPTMVPNNNNNKPGMPRLTTTAKPTEEPGVWRRQLLPMMMPRGNNYPHCRNDNGLQEIAPGAIIVQNDTHTILRARRLHLHNSSLLGSSSSSSHQENGDRLVLDTLIFAVGASNSFAFHKYYGSRPLQSSPCPLEEYDSPSEPFRPSGTSTPTKGIVGVCMTTTMMMITVFTALF